MVYHLPIGHFSVAILSLACVEQPHFLQRPVFAKPDSSQNSQLLQISSLKLRVSESAVVNPLFTKLPIDFAKLAAISDVEGYSTLAPITGYGVGGGGRWRSN